MSRTAKIEWGVFVVSNWTVCGLLGLGFLLEGGARENFLIGIFGIVAITAGFVAHLIANHVFQKGFTKGEAALGLGIYAFAAIVFILVSMLVELSQTAVVLGIGTLCFIAIGFITFLCMCFGVRGAFKKFDAASQTLSGYDK